MKQDVLFPDPKPLARRNDPLESKEAAKEVVKTLAEKQAWALHCIQSRPGWTVNELAEWLDLRDPRRIGRRLPELVRMGRAYKGGTRICRMTGKNAAIWFPVKP